MRRRAKSASYSSFASRTNSPSRNLSMRSSSHSGSARLLGAFVVEVDRALTIGGDALYGQHFSGRIDEVRIFNTVRNAAEIQSDMNTPIGSGA